MANLVAGQGRAWSKYGWNTCEFCGRTLKARTAGTDGKRFVCARHTATERDEPCTMPGNCLTHDQF